MNPIPGGMMKLSIVILLSGLAVGFVAGFCVAPGGPETDEATRISNVGMPETIGFRTDPPTPSKSGGPESGQPSPVVMKVRMPAKRDFEDVAACTQEVERLTAAVEHLAAENMAHKPEMKYEVGEPIPFPDELDPKYLEPALMKNLNKAYEEVGLDGDVSFVDCDEFPCIVCAGLGADQGEEMDMNKSMEKIKKLKESEAMSTYEGSKQQSSIMVRREESDAGSTRTLNNCQVIYPDPGDEQLRQALEKRLNWRMNKLKDTM
jgi:hypothetical protein